jgi:diguanylate cyclase (GGDEF)-like protein
VRIIRSKLLAPVVALLLTVGAIAGVWGLVDRASTSGQAQVRISGLAVSVADLQSAPFNADPSSGGSATVIRAKIGADERSISRGLTAHSQPGVPAGLLTAGRSELAAIEPVVTSIYRIALHGLAAGGARVPLLQARLASRSADLSSVLANIGHADAARAARDRARTNFGSAAVMLLLLAAFAYFYLRSASAREAVERLAREKEVLLGVSRVEARTDALTDLPNRRALASDLASAIAQPSGPHELLLAMFDLDGFKQYNDSFGHGAGDALLGRLGARLAEAVEHTGAAYRMGGDEFCILARCSADSAERLLDDTLAALQESGEGWQVGCSQGAAWIPTEAVTASQALKLADERMYANKAGRASAGKQVTDALLQVISEQDAHLDDHFKRVSELAGTLALALGQPEFEVWRVGLAAKLHDIGKTAIPATILDKPGPLDAQEWVFMRQHPLIGERIVLAAPALAGTAELIRSSHEQPDGQGYPDGLSGQEIPLGSRIIAVCNAFDAMTSGRPYREPTSVDAALNELKRHAGTQFDATVVEAFCKLTSLHHATPELHV